MAKAATRAGRSGGTAAADAGDRPGLDPFPGFGPGAFAFLRGLAANNDRAWFEAHRADYEDEVRAPLAGLVAALGAELARRRLPLLADPAKAMFRIHRDVRFSADKRPYKTHAGASLTRDGAKLSPGLLYIHVEPGACFLGAGIYHPDPQALAALRAAMLAKPAAWTAMLRKLAQGGLDLAPDEEALARLPRGIAGVTDPALAEALRRRNILVRQPLPDAAFAEPAAVARIADFADAARPLLEFGWRALDAAGPAPPDQTRSPGRRPKRR